MKYYSIGIVDYGFGNHASVVHSLRDIGYRVIVTDKKADLDAVDVLILPGVGAFPPAMASLHDRDLIDYLRKQALSKRPLIGICLGMQLLTEASYEYKYSVGLGLIPGDIHPFPNRVNHVGWNTLKFLHKEARSLNIDRETYYFNHSFFYQGPSEYQIAITEHLIPFASIIKSGNIVGLQFHPEKSQLAGKTFLKNLIEDLVNA